MALLFMDGFDHYTNSSGASFSTVTFGTYGYVASGSNINVDILTMPELGGFGAYRDGSAASPTRGSIQRTVPSQNTGAIGAGCHYYVVSGINGCAPISFEAGATNLFRAELNSSGNIQIISGASTVLATSSLALSTETLYHIEMRLDFGDSSTIEVRVNGATFVTVSGIDTNNTAVTGVGFLGHRVIGTHGQLVDNVYIWNDTGSVNNTWLGERNVFTLFPSSDTSTADWSLSTGSDGATLLDNVPPLPSTQYIESSSATDRSEFNLGDLPTLDITITAIQPTILGLKTAASTIEVEYGVITNSVDVPSASTPLTQDQSLYFDTVLEINPDTAAPWDPQEIDDLLIYVERTA